MFFSNKDFQTNLNEKVFIEEHGRNNFIIISSKLHGSAFFQEKMQFIVPKVSGILLLLYDVIVNYFARKCVLSVCQMSK